VVPLQNYHLLIGACTGDEATTQSPRKTQRKRRRPGKLVEEYENSGPDEEGNEEHIEPGDEDESPFKWTRRRQKTNSDQQGGEGGIVTPRKDLNGKNLLSTPNNKGEIDENGTLLEPRDPDRSAKRKSARTIIERTIADNVSEDEVDEDLARHIYESDLEDEVRDDYAEAADDVQEQEVAPVTPSKRGRGRPKGSKARKRSPTPPQDLPPHELYFAQNRAGGMKTSNNNLSSLALLDHEEYFSLLRNYKDPHADDIKFLHELHSRSFNQWQFELSQDFNICVYGWGSKRKLLAAFAEHIYNSQSDHESNRIVVVNGYVHNTTIRDILNTLASAILENPPKLGSQVAEMLDAFCALLAADENKHVTLMIHSIDGIPLRRSTTQTILARLASHPQVNLIASADHPSFPLLWDSSLRSTYNFLFHDCTTFQPYTAETDVVNEVHELLGRSGRRVGGKEGVTFVLKSLNQNSRKLFQLLVAEQLAAMDEGGGGLGGGDDADNADADFDELSHNEKRGPGGGNRHNEQGVEYRLLYQKAVEDFICGDEVSFRTLLKEYVSLYFISLCVC
jgi:origin recognition complex subunit 2